MESVEEFAVEYAKEINVNFEIQELFEATD